MRTVAVTVTVSSPSAAEQDTSSTPLTASAQASA
jgi:hypothetical protein